MQQVCGFFVLFFFGGEEEGRLLLFWFSFYFKCSFISPHFSTPVLFFAKFMFLPVLWKVFMFYAKICIYSNFMS